MEGIIMLQSEEFGDMVSAILQKRKMSELKAHEIIGISAQHIHRMRKGLVPSEAKIDQFTERLQLSSETNYELKVLAGMKPHKDVIRALKKALVAVEDVSEDNKRRIMEFALDVREEPAKE